MSNYFDRMKVKLENLRKKDKVAVLGIESSCDETSISVVVNGREVLSNVIASQIDIHTRFGGVVPEVASRNHIQAIDNVYKQALKEAGIKASEIDAVAVTYGAGLIGALFVGVSFAKALAYSLDVPLIAVNHIRGHISANYIANKNLNPPFICMVMSGAHTSIFRADDYNKLVLLGQTLDDAVGEAFDKVARVIGLGYPGGPKIEKLAKEGQNNIIFKRQNGTKDSLNFSFSGIKTAVINYVNHLEQKGEGTNKADICASFQYLVAKELASKVIRATKESGLNTIVLAGGVSANRFLYEYIKAEAEKDGITVYAPNVILCTDNGAMIASYGYFSLMAGEGLADINLTARANINYNS